MRYGGMRYGVDDDAGMMPNNMSDDTDNMTSRGGMDHQGLYGEEMVMDMEMMEVKPKRKSPAKKSAMKKKSPTRKSPAKKPAMKKKSPTRKSPAKKPAMKKKSPTRKSPAKKPAMKKKSPGRKRK